MSNHFAYFTTNDLLSKIYTMRTEVLSQGCMRLVNLWPGLTCIEHDGYCNWRRHSWSEEADIELSRIFFFGLL